MLLIPTTMTMRAAASAPTPAPPAPADPGGVEPAPETPTPDPGAPAQGPEAPQPVPGTPAPDPGTPAPEPEPAPVSPFAQAATHIVAGAELLVPDTTYDAALPEYAAAVEAMRVGLELLTTTGAPASLVQLVQASLTSAQVAASGVQLRATTGSKVDAKGAELYTAYAPAAIAAAQAGAAWLDSLAPTPDPTPTPGPGPVPAPNPGPVPTPNPDAPAPEQPAA